MTQRPWMPLYIADYLSKTTHLGALESGAFMLLLMHRWQHGSLPTDAKTLARIVRLSERKWSKIANDVLRMFQPSVWGDILADRVVGIGRTDYRPAIPKDVRDAILHRDVACAYCGDGEGPFELDHRLPWSRGGKHTVDNLVLACRHCNRSKGAFTAEEWQQ